VAEKCPRRTSVRRGPLFAGYFDWRCRSDAASGPCCGGRSASAAKSAASKLAISTGSGMKSKPLARAAACSTSSASYSRSLVPSHRARSVAALVGERLHEESAQRWIVANHGVRIGAAAAGGGDCKGDGVAAHRSLLDCGAEREPAPCGTGSLRFTAGCSTGSPSCSRRRRGRERGCRRSRRSPGLPA